MTLSLRVGHRTVAGVSWIEVKHAPIDAQGGHTSYMLVAGKHEGEVLAFPTFNYLLTTPEHRAEIAALLAKDGLHIA
jgi:hypothetical protein